MDTRKKEYIAIGVLTFLLVGIAFYFFITKTSFNTNKIFTNIDSNESFVIFYTNSNNSECSKCKNIKEALDSTGVNYLSFDMKKETTSSKNDLLDELDIDYDLVYPSLIIVNEGKMYANLIDVLDSSAVKDFIEANNVRTDGTIKK